MVKRPKSSTSNVTEQINSGKLEKVQVNEEPALSQRGVSGKLEITNFNKHDTKVENEEP